jgi:hypothetical protein
MSMSRRTALAHFFGLGAVVKVPMQDSVATADADCRVHCRVQPARAPAQAFTLRPAYHVCGWQMRFTGPDFLGRFPAHEDYTVDMQCDNPDCHGAKVRVHPWQRID